MGSIFLIHANVVNGQNKTQTFLEYSSILACHESDSLKSITGSLIDSPPKALEFGNV